MKNLPLAGFRPLFALFLLLALLFGCRKDNFLPIDNPSQIDFPVTASKHSITVLEAMAYFSTLSTGASSSFNDGDSLSFKFVPIEPLWEQAFVGHSPSGSEMAVVPLPDSSFRFVNGGRAGAKLLFSKTSSDSITARVLIYLADTSYYQTSNQILDFNTFTGLFMLFDVGQHFVTGVRVRDGEPVGKVKSIQTQGGSNVEDREEEECDDCITLFESLIRVCQAFAFNDDCFEMALVESEECNCGSEGGGSGSGGNNGNNSGSTGNGTGTGTNNGNNNTPPTYWNVLSGQIPVEIFLQQGGSLPEGFDAQLFRKFIDIYDHYHESQQHLTPQMLHWLSDHADVVAVIWNTLFGSQAGEEAQMVRPVLSLAATQGLDLTGAQFQYLIINSQVYSQIQSFAQQNQPLSNYNIEVVMLHLQLMMGIPLYYQENSQANFRECSQKCGTPQGSG